MPTAARRTHVHGRFAGEVGAVGRLRGRIHVDRGKGNRHLRLLLEAVVRLMGCRCRVAAARCAADDRPYGPSRRCIGARRSQRRRRPRFARSALCDESESFHSAGCYRSERLVRPARRHAAVSRSFPRRHNVGQRVGVESAAPAAGGDIVALVHSLRGAHRNTRIRIVRWASLRSDVALPVFHAV